jgi:hypothetical protein
VRPLRAVLRLIHKRIWNNDALRARNLLRFARTEADGGHDLVRAAETTADPILRRVFMLHAKDEYHHAELFRRRGTEILLSLDPRGRRPPGGEWLAPGERGLDDLRVGDETDATLLAFLHLSEKSAANEFALYRDALSSDPATRTVFEEVLGDETFHMNYTFSQLGRIAPRRRGWLLWRARLSRLWKGYLRVAAALAGLMSGVVLTVLYLAVVPLFALAAKRVERREPLGWRVIPDRGPAAMTRQY